VRRRITVPLEEARNAKAIGASLQAAVKLTLTPDQANLLSANEWAEIAIVSSVELVASQSQEAVQITPASGEKCARCWRVLPEVGRVAEHPSLCLRCVDAVDSGLVCGPAA
jgi:isoleucyl-tRNA synthetase